MKIIVFGAGYWGKNLIRECAGNLVGVIEPDKEKAIQTANTFNVKVYPDLPEDLKFDGAIIATPPNTHVQLAIL